MTTLIVGGTFQWPPSKEEGEEAIQTFINPNQGSSQTSQQSYEQTHQSYQQTQQSYQQTQQSYQQTQQSCQQTQQSCHQTSQQTQQPPKPILKHTPTQQCTESASTQPSESYTPGPGQNVTAPSRGKGVLMQQVSTRDSK